MCQDTIETIKMFLHPDHITVLETFMLCLYYLLVLSIYIYIILVNTPAKMTIIKFLILLFQNSVQLQTLILSSQNQLGQVSPPLLLLKDY